MFGCGEAEFETRFGFGADVVRAAYMPRADRLRHQDGLQRDVLDWLHAKRLDARAALLAGLGLVGALGPVLASMAGPGGSGGTGDSGDSGEHGQHRRHG